MAEFEMGDLRLDALTADPGGIFTAVELEPRPGQTPGDEGASPGGA